MPDETLPEVPEADAEAPEAETPAKPDAVLYQDHHKRGRDAYERLAHADRTFGAVLGAPKVYHNTVVGVGVLCTARPDNTYLDATKSHRYRWVDQGDGTKWGYLIREGGGD